MKSARVVFRVARGVEVRVSQGICRLFESCPLRCKTKGFPRVFRISGQLLWLSCTCMLAGAAQINQQLYCAALPPGESSCESSGSLRNPRFPEKIHWFAAEVVGFEPSCLRNKKTARSVGIGHPTDLPAPYGPLLRFRLRKKRSKENRKRKAPSGIPAKLLLANQLCVRWESAGPENRPRPEICLMLLAMMGG
jgi:hypothetical protein